MAVDLLLRDVRRRADPAPVDLAIAGQRIVAAGPGLDLAAATVLEGAGGLALPGLVNPHQHLDKTRVDDALRPDRWPGWQGMWEVNRRHRAAVTLDEIVARAGGVIDQALGNGTTRMRAFADVEAVAGMTGTRALVALREQWAGEVDVQVAAFPQDLLYAHPGGERRMEEAMEAGADVVGGLPAGEATDERMRAHVDFCLDLARRRDADVHVLADDSDDPAQRSLEYLAVRTVETGWEGRVTASHAGALAAYDEPHARHVVELVRAAGISVCTNPQISLVLHGRDDRGSVRRGTTRVRELLEAGVNVVAGQDDVDDPYYPLGRADPLEVASFVAHACHLAWPAELETAVDMVTGRAARALRADDGYGLEVGDRADIVVVPVRDVRAAIAEQPPRRYVISHGRLAHETRVERIRHPRP